MNNICEHETVKSYNTADGIVVKCAQCGKAVSSDSEDHETALGHFTNAHRKANITHNVHELDLLSESSIFFDEVN